MARYHHWRSWNPFDALPVYARDPLNAVIPYLGFLDLRSQERVEDRVEICGRHPKRVMTALDVASLSGLIL